ncbi:MAG: YggT family protein [Gemmatimonadota bacterium]|nr:YggT family protein [Gemmatimonadota bacterium]
MEVVAGIVQVTRVLVVACFAIASIVAGTHWAVKHGHLSPFGALPRFSRRLGQPLLRPFERRLYRSGGNPVNAPYALFWVSLIGGLALIALVQWLIGTVLSLLYSAESGPRGLVIFGVNAAFSVLMLSILVRVVASWFGVSPYARPMRVVHALSDWVIEPLRKVIPPFGMVDVTPIVAYFMLYLARGLLLSWL